MKYFLISFSIQFIFVTASNAQSNTSAILDNYKDFLTATTEIKNQANEMASVVSSLEMEIKNKNEYGIRSKQTALLQSIHNEALMYSIPSSALYKNAAALKDIIDAFPLCL